MGELLGRNPQNLRISISYDSSWASASPAMRQGFAAAVEWLQSNIFIPTTIRVSAQWSPISANAESFFSSINSTYAVVRNAIVRNARSNIAQQAVSNCFPTSDPLSSTSIVVPMALMRLLELWQAWPANNAGQDSQHIFNSSSTWFYGTHGNPATDLDAFGVAMHEITEGFGRFMTDNSTTAFVSPMNYMRWKSAGVRQTGLQTNAPSYFSIDAGATNLRGFNTAGSGDPMDWDGAVNDCFNAAAGGGAQTFSQPDKWLLDAIGMSSIPNPP